MNISKLTILFLTLLIAQPMAMRAVTAKEPKNDARYLEGAVPEVDGKIVFSKEFQIPGMNEAQIYSTMSKWINERLQENNNDNSRVVLTNEAEGTITGIGEEWLVFTSNALVLDQSKINYQLTVTCKQGGCLVEIEKIRFTYRDTERYKAEEWISDKYALNKNKTKLVPILAKWRRKTVDFADDMFMDVAVAFGAPDTRHVKNERKKESSDVIASSGSVVIGQGGQISTVGKVSTDVQGYVEVDLRQIPGEIYVLMGSGKLIISIGEDEDSEAYITVDGGGALGYQAGKAVAYCTLAADQSYEMMEKADSYKLKVYTSGQTIPSAIIECKKLDSPTSTQAGQSRTYVGEIEKLLIQQ